MTQTAPKIEAQAHPRAPEVQAALDAGRADLRARGIDLGQSERRHAAEAEALFQIKAGALPPVEMLAAPLAPARGTMHLAAEYMVTKGGMRQQISSHWLTCDGLMKMIGRAMQRHRDTGMTKPFVAPFTGPHLTVAGQYRSLTEWRAGSALKCASIEAGRGGGGDGPEGYMVRYMKRGAALDEMHDAIGHAIVLRVRRGVPDGRRSISARALVDSVVLFDGDLTDVLRRFGWAKDSANRNHLRAALVAALDRMVACSGGVQEGA